MRIIHVSPYFAPAFRYGGPPQSILGLCQGLVAAGVDVEVLTTTANGADPLPVATGLTLQDGVPARYFPLSFPKRYWRAAGLNDALVAAAAHADLVHVHGIWNFAGWSGVRAARRAGVPYVISPRGMLQPRAMARHRASKALAFAMIERAHLRGAAFLHATSADEAHALESFGPPIVTIPNGVTPLPVTGADVDRVRRAAGVPDDAPAILFLGRIHPIKRLDLLAEAFVKVRRIVPDARLIVAGPDEGGYRRAVEPLFREAADAVHWIGAVDGVDKWAWLAASRVLVQCSDSESFGMSVAEAFAAAVPVVVTDRGPWRDVEAADCGLVVPHTADALAAGLARLVLDRAGALRMGARGRVLAAQQFGWDDIARAMIRAYDEALVRSIGRLTWERHCNRF